MWKLLKKTILKWNLQKPINIHVSVKYWEFICFLQRLTLDIAGACQVFFSMTIHLTGQLNLIPHTKEWFCLNVHLAILPFPVLWHRLWYLILLCSAPKSGNITKSQKHISLDFNSVCPRIWLLDAMLEQNINFSVLFFTTLVLSFNWFLVHTSWIRSYWYPNYRVSDGKNWYLHLIYLI